MHGITIDVTSHKSLRGQRPYQLHVCFADQQLRCNPGNNGRHAGEVPVRLGQHQQRDQGAAGAEPVHERAPAQPQGRRGATWHFLGQPGASSIAHRWRAACTTRRRLCGVALPGMT